MLMIDLDSSLRLQYLAEGAANVVYRILFSSSCPSVSSDPDIETSGDSPATPLPSEIPPIHPENLLYGKLLRLRKNLPSLVPVIDSHKYFESTIQPLFTPQNLVEQLLFQPSRDLIEDCNGSLRRMEVDGSRARKRHGVYLAEEETYGSLITDMTSGDDDYYASIEFKPKWLVQSPSAPPGYTRCRTCALRAMKFSKRKHLGETEHLKLGFCPLSLVSGNEMEIAAAATIILDLSKQVWANEEIVWQGLKEFLLTSPLLHQLKKLQIEMDPHGVLRADLSSSDFLTAMTIRDCTLFLKIPRFGHTPVEARLGDLDLKTPKGQKGEYWRSVERQLIDGGWYTGTEKLVDSRRSSCQLSAE